MNIVIVPSWYVSNSQPLSGIFFREQAILFAKQNPEIYVHVVYVFRKKFYQDSDVFPLRHNGMPENFIEHFDVVNTFLPIRMLPFCKKKYLKFRDSLVANKYIKIVKNIISDFGYVSMLHAHGIYSGGYFAKLISDEYDIPYMIQEHMSTQFMSCLPIYSNGKLNQFAISLLDNARLVCAVGSKLAKLLQSVTQNKVLILPNFINDSYFKAVSNKVNMNFKFLCVANLISHKRINILVKAFGQLIHYKKVNAQLTIVGSGGELAYLTSLVESLKLLNFVEFKGSVPREQIAALFDGCNCFVLPSSAETFGVVYLEAIACGRPIIATRCGGPEDIVSPVNGILINVDDVEQLTTAMNEIIENIHIYDANQIRSDYEKRFGTINMIQNLKQLYFDNGVTSNA